MSTEAELQEEVWWLASRLAVGAPWYIGISSNALVKACVLGDKPDQLPRDPSDLARCVYAVETAPAHLRDRAEAMLAVFEAHVQERYPVRVAPRPRDITEGARGLVRARHLAEKK